MEIFFVCSNLFVNNLIFADEVDIERRKMTRPLSREGEILAQKLSEMDFLQDTSLIYSSMASSSLCGAKYLAEKLKKDIIVSENLNDPQIGKLGNKSLKMLKYMQNHNFGVKLDGGESLEEVSKRICSLIDNIITFEENKIVLYTHKRTMLGYLIKNGAVGFNLDDDLVVEFNGKVIYNESDKDIDIIKIILDENYEVSDMDVIDI